jgi:hypothetical protein
MLNDQEFTPLMDRFVGLPGAHAVDAYSTGVSLWFVRSRGRDRYGRGSNRPPLAKCPARIVRFVIVEAMGVQAQHDLLDLKQVFERCRIGRAYLLGAPHTPRRERKPHDCKSWERRGAQRERYPSSGV